MKMKRFLALVLGVMLAAGSVDVTLLAQEAEVQIAAEQVDGEVCADVEIELTDEELYEGYVESLLYPEQVSTWSIRNKLTGKNLAVYNKLKEYLAQTARGERESTTYTITAEEAGFSKTSWTAEELGVSTLVADNGITGIKGITQEAKQAFAEKVYINGTLIFRTLLADCPYELYWFDKTVGMSGPEYSMASDGTSIWLETPFTFKFSVAGEYAKGQYIFNNEKISKVTTAVQNANAIIEEYKYSSDYDKLEGYFEEICDLVSYDFEAADEKNRVPYGNPWQLIHVFDGDESTKVVCEGYSKAFQYLCDRTTFKNENINCVSVSGIMYGIGTTGAHMWNVLTMDDGRNYLVDVTNCDEGMSGSEKQLYIAEAASGSVSAGYAFQCKGGTIRYAYDEKMWDVYDTSELTISNAAYVKKEEPAHNVVVDEAVEATCTTTGLTKGSHCSICGTVFEEQEVIPEKGHAFVWIVDKQPTEDAYGYKHQECKRCHTKQNENTQIPKLESKPINNFTDVKENDYFYTPVMWAVANGVTSGMSPTTFAPNAACTRAQVVAFLWRAAGKPMPTVSASPFVDVKPGAYYYEAVLWAVENGITSGMSATSFAPDAVCTRGQIVTFLHRYAHSPAPDTRYMQFYDVKAGEYYYNAVLWAVENGITSGMSATSFAPNAVCTRGQVVTFLYRYMED